MQHPHLQLSLIQFQEHTQMKASIGNVSIQDRYCFCTYWQAIQFHLLAIQPKQSCLSLLQKHPATPNTRLPPPAVIRNTGTGWRRKRQQSPSPNHHLVASEIPSCQLGAEAGAAPVQTKPKHNRASEVWLSEVWEHEGAVQRSAPSDRGWVQPPFKEQLQHSRQAMKIRTAVLPPLLCDRDSTQSMVSCTYTSTVWHI